MTMTWFTPPFLMVGTTSSIMSPSRRWTCISAEAAISSPSFFQLSKTILAVVVVNARVLYVVVESSSPRGWKYGGVRGVPGRTAGLGWAVKVHKPRLAVPDTPRTRTPEHKLGASMRIADFYSLSILLINTIFIGLTENIVGIDART